MSSSDDFRLTGRFRHLNQGQFFIYDTERGMRDTIHVRNGRLEYERTMEDPALLMLQFPNFSELPIFAQPGQDLEIDGDASHLRTTKVTGDNINEEMTDFRLNTADLTPPEQRRVAARYAEENAASPIALYLVQRFFVQCDQPDYVQAHRLCSLVVARQPDNLQAVRLSEQLASLKNATDKGPLPQFQATSTDGRRVDRTTLLKGDVGVVVVWASWNYESHNLLQQLHRRAAAHKQRLAVVSVCLDASPKEGRRILERDSISWPNVCDGRMWRSPVLAQLGLALASANVVVDKQGNIIGRNLTTQDMMKLIDERLK